MNLIQTQPKAKTQNPLYTREDLLLAQKQLDDALYGLEKGDYFEKCGYHPHPKQEAIHRSKARFVVAICGRRFGKSLSASKEVEVRATNNSNQRIWVVSPTYELSKKVFREIWNTFARVDRGRFVAKKSEHNLYIQLINGSEIIGKSADNPDSLIGEGLDYLVLDEAAKIKYSVWEKYLRPTLSDRKGSALFITTPEGMNWIYDLYLKGQDPEEPDFESFHGTTWDNPKIEPEEIERIKANNTEEVFYQEYGAEFKTFVGKVYADFDQNIHVIQKRPPLKEFEKTIMGMDFGFVNETAILIIGIKDGRYYVLDEIYKPKLDHDNIADELIRMRQKYPEVVTGYADHDDRMIKTIKKIKIDPKFKIIRAKKDVTNGIKKVNRMLKLDENGKPNLFVDARCRNLIDEMERYRYSELKTINVREDPVKLKDHAVDALRYAIYSHETGGSAKSLKGDFIT